MIHPTQRERFEYDARGLRSARAVTLITLGGEHVAFTSHDHRGLRNTKTVCGTTTYYLHDESRQPLADLDVQGRIQRQYVYLADLPIAVIDTPGRLVADDEGMASVLDDLAIAFGSWINKAEGVIWLHTNHLGAPEAASNAQGDLVWRARYAPFGAARIEPVRPEPVEGRSNPALPSPAFSLNLRLPGQVYDAETGLHYNRQRYYDPALGQYLTPDPLGHPDGPNPYAYVAFNPLGFVDPDGLVLFAFDGTGNSDNTSDPAMRSNGLSNVRRFFDLYQSGPQYYVSGVGTVHRDRNQRYAPIVPDTYAQNTRLDWLPGSGPLWVNDMGGNYSGPARIDRMMLHMRDASDDFDNGSVMDIDIVGFSRGAAQARDFANRLVASSVVRDGRTYYNYTNRAGQATCQAVNFRFMGLWDTVLSTNYSGTSYSLEIPSAFRHVAHAVALNEYRSDSMSAWQSRNPIQPNYLHFGGFPLQSIGASSNRSGSVRIERGFIGAHADIGGGYAASEGQLSIVALRWMVRQAQDALVTMGAAPQFPTGNPIIHDQSNAINLNDPRVPENLGRRAPYTRISAEDRVVNGACGGSTSSGSGCLRGNTTQRSMSFSDPSSMTNDDTHRFISYRPRDVNALGSGTDRDSSTFRNNTGTVNLAEYIDWLNQHGYTF